MTPITSVSTVLLLVLSPGEHRHLDVGTAPVRSPRSLAGPDGEDPAAECVIKTRMDPAVTHYLERVGLRDAWLQVEALLATSFSRIIAVTAELREEPEQPGQYFVHVTVGLNADAEQAWPEYRAFTWARADAISAPLDAILSFEIDLP